MISSSPQWRISVQAWVSLLGLGLALLVLFRYGAFLMEVLGVLFGAFLLSLLLRPPADWLARWRIPRGLTVMLAYLAGIGLLVLIGGLLVPMVQRELVQLRTHGPTLLESVVNRISSIPGLKDQLPTFSDLAHGLVQRLSSIMLSVVGALSRLGEIAVELIVVLVLAFFFACDPDNGDRLLNRWVGPLYYRKHVHQMTARLTTRLTYWIWAQFATALFFGVTFGSGLALLGVPFALTIALTGAVLEIIPFVGSFTALILAILSALTIGPWLALWVIVLHQLIVQVEINVIVPYLSGHAARLHPAVVILVLLIGARIAGIVGVLFAVPLTIVVMTVLDELRAATIHLDAPPIAESNAHVPAVDADSRPEHTRTL